MADRLGYSKVLHILRNPHGFAEAEVRAARLEAADRMESVGDTVLSEVVKWALAGHITEAGVTVEAGQAIRAACGVETIDPTGRQIIELAQACGIVTGENLARGDDYLYRSHGTPTNVYGRHLIEFARAVRAFLAPCDGCEHPTLCADFPEQHRTCGVALPAKPSQPDVKEAVAVIRGIMEFIRVHAEPKGFDPELAERRVNARLDQIVAAFGVSRPDHQTESQRQPMKDSPP
jgi:hypothetical protein